MAEVAFAVDDQLQGKGLGTALLERLAAIASANGFVRFEATTLADNAAMLDVFRESGFAERSRAGQGSVNVELSIDVIASANPEIEHQRHEHVDGLSGEASRLEAPLRGGADRLLIEPGIERSNHAYVGWCAIAGDHQFEHDSIAPATPGTWVATDVLDTVNASESPTRKCPAPASGRADSAASTG